MKKYLDALSSKATEPLPRSVKRGFAILFLFMTIGAVMIGVAGIDRPNMRLAMGGLGLICLGGIAAGAVMLADWRTINVPGRLAAVALSGAGLYMSYVTVKWLSTNAHRL